MENQSIIILDEPFNGVENKSVEKLINYFVQQKNNDKLIIISTHIKEDLNKLTNNILFFEDGQVKFENK